MSFKGKLGRNKPYPASVKPRVVINDYMNLGALPAPPNVIDYSTKVPSWPMYMNGPDPSAPPQISGTGIGDCTFAYVGHATQAWTCYANTEVTLPDSAILKGYEDVGGYVLGNSSTDNGCVIQDVLNYWRTTGVGGHKIVAFAELKNLTDWTVIKQALDIFGSIDLGINFPAGAMDQFNNGQPWDIVPGDYIEGGHCVGLQRWDQTVPNGYAKVITWGQEQAVRLRWWAQYVEEAWVIITQDWLNSKGTTIQGLNLSALNTDLADLTGSADPLGLTTRL